MKFFLQFSKRSADYFQGRTDGNIKVIFPMSSVPEFCSYQSNRTIRKGDYVDVKVCFFFFCKKNCLFYFLLFSMYVIYEF